MNRNAYSLGTWWRYVYVLATCNSTRAFRHNKRVSTHPYASAGSAFD